jgi:hypothetical protein
MSRPAIPPAKRFEKFVDRSGKCHLWTGGVLNSGYGQFSLGVQNNTLVHRFAWEQQFGPVPDGLQVCHTCDEPLCVNINHLWVGTPKDNADDMVEKGRQRSAYGEKSASAKLTEKQVLEIRESDDLLRVLAVRYGMGQSQISKIKRREAWAHL